ncbi:hypothetical protein IGJ94_002351 [Enterococcus sp. AZ153]|uniref:hypothetical protein n=1 Tax=unclassified Enterococcus TaxID=2608891 RepID=UPI003F1E82CF
MINKKMMSTMAILGTVLIGGTIVNAQTTNSIQNGSTPVTYDNRNILPDNNAQYGMVIPTAISFSDNKKEADASVQIVGINGYDIDTDWTELDVTTKVKSQNSYKLKNDNNKEVSYKLKMENNSAEFTANDQEQEISKHFGKGGDTVKEEEGTATLTGKATEKGQYTDTLTYTFTENTNTPT